MSCLSAERMDIMEKIKPRSEIVSQNNYNRFTSLHVCYCPKCGKLLKRSEEKCTCGQEIDWEDFE